MAHQQVSSKPKAGPTFQWSYLALAATKLLHAPAKCCIAMEKELGILQSSAIFLFIPLTENMIPYLQLRMSGLRMSGFQARPVVFLPA